MLMLGFNIYSPAGFVNVSSGIGTDLSLISYILLPVRTLNVVYYYTLLGFLSKFQVISQSITSRLLFPICKSNP